MGIRAVAENVGNFNRKIGSMNKGIQGSSKAMAKSAKTSISLKKAMTGLGVAVAGVAVALAGMKKAFAFGREGALVTQTGESFDFLLKKIGANVDLLTELSRASRGTISELDLMTSTATLLAGAGDELALKLADATPQLLEIAKAANKLNPALGTTAFLYQSIATGVKRAQPLILDNLGITIKVGEANEQFAKSIGKAVKELNAEERAMAILQGTLEAGGNLIDQVGGDTESLTDSFDRLTVAITEVAHSSKSKLAVALEPLADRLADAITASTELARAEDFLADVGLNVTDMLARQQLGYEDLGLTTDTYGEQVLELAERFKDVNKRVHDFRNILQEFPPLVKEVFKPPVVLDIKLMLAESSLQAASTRLFQWSQEQQNKLRLTVHVELAAAQAAAGGAGLAEFQHGGQFTVGGKSGIDQNLVAFMASRGEVVTVSPAQHFDQRSVNTGPINISDGQMSAQTFDRMIRDWMG